MECEKNNIETSRIKLYLALNDYCGFVRSLVISVVNAALWVSIDT